MTITRLEYNNFRNIEHIIIEPCSGINVLYGANAQGKTNMLEGIWLLGGGRSFRGSHERDFIKFGEGRTKISVDFFSGGREQSAQIIYSDKEKKQVKLNGINKKSVSSLSENVYEVVFSPEHLTLVKGGPGERRRFIDEAIAKIKPVFADAVSKYNRTLAQQNALLKNIYYDNRLADTLDAWSVRLAALGAFIIRMRVKYIKKLSQCAGVYHMGISNNKENLTLSYGGTIADDNEISRAELENILIQKLRNSREEDIHSGTTSVGPHRDDVNIYVNDKLLKAFGSQGQQRSCVMSLKLAEAQLLGVAKDEEPIIILDDVLSELDSDRREFLLNKIAGRQVFISSCDSTSVPNQSNSRIFRINNGSLDSY